MGYQDREWYRNQTKPSEAGAVPRERFRRSWLPSGSTPAWKIAAFWVVVAVGLTALFQPVVLERQAKRMVQPVVKMFCSVGAKCT